jgi:hypothetical protein
MSTPTVLIDAALRVIGAVAKGETPSASDRADGLEALQIMFRGWSAERLMIFYYELENFSLTGAQSYTIGSGGNFNTVRPVKIESAYVNASGLDWPIRIIGEKQYTRIGDKSEAGTPERLWYNPKYGSTALGVIYVWPVSSDTLYINSLKPLTEPSTVTTTLELPPEYDEAIKWGLVLRLAPEYGRPVDQLWLTMAADAKSDLISYNASNAIDSVLLEMTQMTRRWNIDQG